jgi:hypothetical protein
MTSCSPSSISYVLALNPFSFSGSFDGIFYLLNINSLFESFPKLLLANAVQDMCI